MSEKSTTTRRAGRTSTSADGFTAEERAAMKERARELKAAKAGADAEQALLAKIAEMNDTDRAMAERVHALVKETAPELAPKLWYGMPAYARDGAVVCFFQPAEKFSSRYATFGFNDGARLDDGAMWPTSFALTKVGPAEEKAIRDLVRRAAG